MYVGFIGKLFLRMLKCVIIPLIIPSLIASIGKRQQHWSFSLKRNLCAEVFSTFKNGYFGHVSLGKPQKKFLF